MSVYKKPKVSLKPSPKMICQTQSGLAIICRGVPECGGEVYTECMNESNWIDGDFVLPASSCASGVVPRIYINGTEINSSVCSERYEFDPEYCTDHSCYYYFSCQGDIINCAEDNLVVYTAEGYESCELTVHS